VGELVSALLRSELISMRKLYECYPIAVPRPFKTGEMARIGAEECHYYISEFKEFESRELPEPAAVAELVSKLHHQCFEEDQYFGSDIDGYDGCFRIPKGQYSNWQSCYTDMLANAYRYDCLTNGVSPDLDHLFQLTIDGVIPRLLGSLKFQGQPIKPCFIHGDLWEQNFGLEKGSKRLYVFDANGYFAHHEMDLAVWTTKHHKMHLRPYLAEYQKRMPVTEPIEEFQDRLTLYSVKAYLMYSASCRGHITRQ
jgi:protein-ribulosamine 3-kinase